MPRHRRQRAKHQEIASWPEGPPPPGDVAARVRYPSASGRRRSAPTPHRAIRTGFSMGDPPMLDFQIEWLDAPGVKSEILAATWARLKIVARSVDLGERVVSRLLSGPARSERDGI